MIERIKRCPWTSDPKGICGEVESIDEVEDEACQMSFREPVADVGRQKERLGQIEGDEGACHASRTDMAPFGINFSP